MMAALFPEVLAEGPQPRQRLAVFGAVGGLLARDDVVVEHSGNPSMLLPRLASGRPSSAVQVAVDVHRVRRHPPQRHVGEEEQRVGVADGCRVLLVEAGGRQFRARVDVVVPENQRPLARAAGDVQPQSAVVVPSVEVGDIAEADDRVAGADASPPLGQQRAVHVPDVPERSVPAIEHRWVAEVKVRPDPGPFGIRPENRDGCRAQQVEHQVLAGGALRAVPGRRRGQPCHPLVTDLRGGPDGIHHRSHLETPSRRQFSSAVRGWSSAGNSSSRGLELRCRVGGILLAEHRDASDCTIGIGLPGPDFGTVVEASGSTVPGAVEPSRMRTEAP